MPKVEQVARTPILDIGTRVEPASHLGELGVGIVRHPAKFNNDIELVTGESPATETPVGLDGFKKEGV
jgi:hypothetical protein